MDTFDLSGTTVTALSNIGTAVGTGNISNITAMAGFIAVVVTVGFAMVLVRKGLGKIGF